MGDMGLVLVAGGGWCGLLGVVVALMAVARRAEERFEAPLSDVRAPRVPRFTRRRPERELPRRDRASVRA